MRVHTWLTATGIIAPAIARVTAQCITIYDIYHIKMKTKSTIKVALPESEHPVVLNL